MQKIFHAETFMRVQSCLYIQQRWAISRKNSGFRGETASSP
jgi:hypothetical protein